MALSDRQVDLYSRQIILPELGGLGQRRLLAARCLVRGCGPAFASAATYLAGAGIGRLDLASHGTDGPSAFAPLRERNPDVVLGFEAAAQGLYGYDVVIEAPGAQQTRASARQSGSAARGEVEIVTLRDRTEVSLVPSGAGCLDCCVPDRRETSPGAAAETAQAGSLAALAALSWIMTDRKQESAKCLTLARGEPTWGETPLGRTPGCPRPCRSGKPKLLS